MSCRSKEEMDDELPESLPSFPKFNNYPVYFLQDWVDRFGDRSHFDDSDIAIHTAKGYDTNFKSSDLVQVYKKLKVHLRREIELRLMPKSIK